MLFLDGVYFDSTHGSPARFRWVKAPTSEELTRLTHTIAQRIARYLERQGCWCGYWGVARMTTKYESFSYIQSTQYQAA